MPIFECKVCKYSTSVNSNLHKHFRTNKHIKNIKLVYGSTLQCNDCNQRFNSLDLLNEHLLQCYVTKDKIDKRTIVIEELNDTINKQKTELDMGKLKLESHINNYTILVKEKENYINYLENRLRDNNIHYKNHLPEYSTSNDIYQDILDNNIEKEVKLELDLKKNSNTMNENTIEHTKLENYKPITTNIEIEKSNLYLSK